MKPAIQFLELMVTDPDNIFNEYIIRETNRRKGIQPIKYYFENEVIGPEGSHEFSIVNYELTKEEKEKSLKKIKKPSTAKNKKYREKANDSLIRESDSGLTFDF